MPTEVIMPQLGDSVNEGTVSKWLKREGEKVTQFDPLLEVSGDKIDTEIPAPVSGVVLKILTPVGQLVTAGVCLAVIGEAEEAENNNADQQRTRHAVSETNAINGHMAEYTGYVSPVVARMVAEHQLDLARVVGTGRDGRVTKKDVEGYLAHIQTPPPSPLPELKEGVKIPIPKAGTDVVGELRTSPPSPLSVYSEGEPKPEISGSKIDSPTASGTGVTPQSRLAENIPQSAGGLVPLTAMRRTIAEHMVRSKLQTAPHVTTVFEFDMSAVITHREANKETFAKEGVHLTLTAYFAVATVQALQSKRYLNAQWTNEGIFLHNVVNLGIAVALEDGLLVPVVKNAGDLNLMGMARAVNDLATRARSEQLKRDEVQGGTFTITNHGVSGSLLATPIINQPQSGILGIGMMEKRVKVIHDMIAIRPCCYVTLTFDHRVADGATGDGFMQQLKDRIENWI